MTTCPTCGQPVDPAGDAERLLALLSDGTGKSVYRGADGSGWYVTCHRGRFSWPAVERLIKGGHIHSSYNSCPNDSYHVGKTLDCDATTAERKKHKRGKDAPLIYTDGSRG